MTPILMYHELSLSQDAYQYTIPVNIFREQMETIADLGKRGISVSELMNGSNENSVVITFDDGHATDLSIALPVLKEFGFRATFYITTGNIDTTDNWLTWNAISELLAEGMDVQVHGHSHVFLDMHPSQLLQEELEKPIRLFKNKLGHKVNHLSLPGGRFNETTIRYAKNLEYRTISTSRPGQNTPNINDFPQILRRYVIHQKIGIEEFKKIIHADKYYSFIANLKYDTKITIKKILGNELYQKIWLKVVKYYHR
jgi:peptidoglycan/xylan/chitin deacetylase (PgdA/CDA1 family)